MLSVHGTDSPTLAAPRSSPRFDTIMAGVSTWMVLGLYIDGWSHRHVALDTFFSPYHAIFYSGYLAFAVLILLTLAKGILAGLPFRQALPIGYGKSLLGLILHGAGGVVDMAWHQVFGFELSSEALVSPPHLMIFAGLTLIVSGPLRAAWLRPEQAALPSRRYWTPMLISLALLWSVLTFGTLILHPIVAPHAIKSRWVMYASFPGPALDMARTVSIGSFIVQSAITAGLLLLLIRRWQLPRLALTLVFTANAALLSLLDDQYWLILPSLCSGWATDWLLTRLQPCGRRPWTVRLVAATVPLVSTTGYFITLAATAGVGWSATMVTGAITLSAMTGLLISYMVFPPPTPTHRASEHGI